MKALIFATLLLALPVYADASIETKTWYFDVFLGDKPIGKHSFELKKENEAKTIRIVADFDVSFLIFNAYSYDHSNVEQWEKLCLKKLDSQTDDNGDLYEVKATYENNAMSIQTNDTKVVATAECVKSFAYWDPHILGEEYLLNAQNGEYTKVDVIHMGKDKLNVRGTEVNTNHYQLKTDEFTIELWYSEKGEWLGLKSTTSDGNTLRYVLR